MGRLRRRNNLLHGGPRLTVGDVVKNCPVEQPGILQNHGIGPPEGIPGQGPDVLAVQEDLPGVHIVKAH